MSERGTLMGKGDRRAAAALALVTANELRLLLPERCADEHCPARCPVELWPDWTNWVNLQGVGFVVCPAHFRWAAEQSWRMKR